MDTNRGGAPGLLETDLGGKHESCVLREVLAMAWPAAGDHRAQNDRRLVALGHHVRQSDGERVEAETRARLPSVRGSVRRTEALEDGAATEMLLQHQDRALVADLDFDPETTPGEIDVDRTLAVE